MSFAKFLGAALVVAANSYVENNNRKVGYEAESTEDAKWTKRKQDGLDAIDDAMVADHRDGMSMYSKNNKANRLRGELKENIAKRSEALTAMTEREIERFVRNGL